MLKAQRQKASQAAKALLALLNNPDDTAQVFKTIETLSGDTQVRIRNGFRKTEAGARLLREQPSIVSVLSNREALRALPEGSLGRTYLAFVEAEGITADGLVEASQEGATPHWLPDPEVRFVHFRMRDTHDLWHAVTGYRGDVVGEASLLAFSLAQIWNPAIAAIVGGALITRKFVGNRRVIVEGFRRGLRAEWFPAQDWEALLPLPVSEVRRRLRVDELTPYQQVRTAEWQRRGIAGRIAALA